MTSQTIIVKLHKQYHQISVSEYHIQSPASYLLLKNVYKIRETEGGRTSIPEMEGGRTSIPEWRQWLTFRNKYVRQQLKRSKGNLVCFYCGEKYLDPNLNNPFRKKKRKLATIDHKVALAKGGPKYITGNLCICCKSCNTKKKDMSVFEFKKKVSK